MDVQKALGNLKEIRNRLAPFRSYVPEAAQLDEIISALEAGNVQEGRERLTQFRKAMERYMSMAPERVKPLLDAVDSTLKELE
ncbi:MAG: hypothetical protein QXL85_08370 [Candidatus Bathyarchaeia archaeon]